MYCVKCGAQLDDHAKFCNHCGNAVRRQEPAAPPREPAPPQENAFQGGESPQGTGQNAAPPVSLETAVNHSAYYLAEFKKIENHQPAKFNWAAFFLGPFLLLYRRMQRSYLFNRLCVAALALYLVSMLLLSVNLLAGIGLYVLSGFLYFIFAIIIGKRFNEEYYQQLQQSLQSGAAAPNALLPSIKPPLLLFALLMVLSIALNLLVGASAIGQLAGWIEDSGFSLGDEAPDLPSHGSPDKPVGPGQKAASSSLAGSSVSPGQGSSSAARPAPPSASLDSGEIYIPGECPIYQDTLMRVSGFSATEGEVGSSGMLPAGYRYVTVEVDIWNLGDSPFSYSPYLFKMQNGSGGLTNVTLNITPGDALTSGQLEAGEMVSGSLSFEEPGDEYDLTLCFYGSSKASSPALRFDIPVNSGVSCYIGSVPGMVEITDFIETYTDGPNNLHFLGGYEGEISTDEPGIEGRRHNGGIEIYEDTARYTVMEIAVDFSDVGENFEGCYYGYTLLGFNDSSSRQDMINELGTPDWEDPAENVIAYTLPSEYGTPLNFIFHMDGYGYLTKGVCVIDDYDFYFDSTSAPSGILTEEDAVAMVRQYFESSSPEAIPQVIEVTDFEDGVYTVHAFNQGRDTLATRGWFTVDSVTGKMVDTVSFKELN